MIKFFNKKTIVLVFIALIIFSFALKPIPAQAGILDILYKIATEVLKQVFLNRMVNQTVIWIQGGGDPKFITDWPGFLREGVDQAGGQFLYKAIGPQICEPFRLTLKYALFPVSTFDERTTCTLTGIGKNLEDFLKDFENGGWVTWQEMVLNPQNNVYGAYLLSWDQLEIAKSAAAKAAESEAQAGKGFLSTKRCVPGYLDSAVESECYNRTGDAKQCKKEACTKWETTTPGDIVGNEIKKALGTDFDHIVNADDLAAYAIAIVNAIVNRLTKEGIGLLDINSTPEGPPLLSAETRCASLNVDPSTPETEAEYNFCLFSFGGGQTSCDQYPQGTENYEICIAAILRGGGTGPSTQTECGLPSDTGYDNCIIAMKECVLFWGTGGGGYDKCMTYMKLQGADIGKFRKEYALAECAPLKDTEVYNNCLDEIENGNPDIGKFRKDYGSTQCATVSGLDQEGTGNCISLMQNRTTDIKEFEKIYMLDLIGRHLLSQNQLLWSKQTIKSILDVSVSTLNQLKDCQSSMSPESPNFVANIPATLDHVKSAVSATGIQITRIQSDIIALEGRQGKINDTTDISQIPALWVEWVEFVKTAKPLSIQGTDVSDARDEIRSTQGNQDAWNTSLINCRR